MLRAPQTLRRAGSSAAATRGAPARLQCRAVRRDAEAEAAVLDRRAMLLGAATPLLMCLASPALALILDEEDEELVEKAKANRQNRLAEQRATTREFLKAEGLKDVKLDQELIPVQKGIFRLAESGSKLESGDVRGASAILSESWSADFTTAAGKIGSSDSVAGKLQALKAAASSGDASASKTAYVALVAEIQSWTASAGLSNKLKGI